ncbi:1-acyl-sn-glycerol-3-phosphate acyltransferase [Sinomicrobium kalidii]|uniref:1-acyl-sn-glycerol-3-phosphate acyltransferase n=1 Tax=Sinomicrobium kalidii TaxID=2900738 RepID=UPI001E578D83|nr:1-acyl-sn-glycerol-3-phosphate acyltransferase [Sinomicrobium kalidii]UGU17570.1 1-acyl-sn-glycerol-3-phosphate acyltransferase [Sinomicrobium kalidii]
MDNYKEIRPYLDSEVKEALKEYKDHPMIRALLYFTFPDKSQEEIEEILASCNSVSDFQAKVIYNSVRHVLEKSSEGFFMSGFEKLKPDTSYLFVSNHRDIVMDTSLLNVALLENNLVMTASAIGDNLVKKPFLLALSRLVRNFLIQRGLSPREMLESSRKVSGYIRHLLREENRSVWIAQREGRTKDGNDQTQQGVLKMLALASDEKEIMDYFKKLRIAPVSISYEYDPTDLLKMPELMARHYDLEYVKTSNEDFNSILKGALGQKKRICIKIGDVLDTELDDIKYKREPVNKQFQLLADHIDEQIHKNYRLWPTNYLAYDLLNGVEKFADRYNEKEKRQFERRLERRVGEGNHVARQNFLAMYANPVVNRMKYEEG